MRVLIITWGGGGASQPALGLGRRLVERGHDVRVVGPRSFGERVSAAACRLRAYPAELELDPSSQLMFEEQSEYAVELFFGQRLPALVDAELDLESADVVVVDYLLRTVACRLEARPMPVVLLTHMAYRHAAPAVDEREDEWSQRWQYRLVNQAREEMGLRSLPVGPEALCIALGRRADRVIVTIPRELDPWPEIPAHVVHVGPIPEETAADSWNSPWAANDPTPLVVISMSTMYMRHETVLGRAASAAAACGARVLVLTGFELDPDSVTFPSGVIVRSYVPHSHVLPQASLVVTHAGIGTLIAAFAAGVPTICLPLGRDQHVNAARAQKLGASITLAADSDQPTLEQAIHAALTSPNLVEAAQLLASRLAAYGDGRRAVEIVEQLGMRATV
ncbi:MAG: glycosyltransferase [Actinomycetota bacterium]